MSCEEFVALGAGFPDKRVGFPESTMEFRVLHFALRSHSFITRMHRFELCYCVISSSRELWTVAASSIPISESPTHRSIL
jgi:hypothetical protein